MDFSHFIPPNTKWNTVLRLALFRRLGTEFGGLHLSDVHCWLEDDTGVIYARVRVVDGDFQEHFIHGHFDLIIDMSTRETYYAGLNNIKNLLFTDENFREALMYDLLRSLSYSAQAERAKL